MNQFLKLAKDVLLDSPTPLIYQDIWTKAVEMKLDCNIKSTGKTPWQTLGARLYVEVRDNPTSEFVKIGKRPVKFFLKSKQDTLSQDTILKLDLEESETRKPVTGPKYSERALHPLLSYFAYTNTQFNRGKAILTKTIFHEKSRRDGLNEWVHPDIVGVYIPIEDWNRDILDLNNITSSNAITLYSFELKKKLDRSNYREYFFQAVSNSSWANESYLVAAEIRDDDELLNELERLSTSFGIGLIQIDLEDVDSSRVVFHAQKKKELDWETMNKLSDLNADFKKFIQDVKIDFESKRIHKSEYDRIIDEPDEYAEKLAR